jgi:2-amino-4-hydroxy-6-hydroxymethyldihydropteridine diphosphokinase
MRVVFGIGSNLGDRLGHLTAAVRGLAALGASLVVSPVYETEPVGGPAGQGPYLNCVVLVETDKAPRELLEAAWRLESAGGRVRTVKDGPRTLDIDVLLIEGLAIDEPDLVVPHPRMGERAFVLAPLEDVAPELAPAGWRERLGGHEIVDRSVKRVGTLEVG